MIADPSAAAGGFLVSWRAPGTQENDLAIHLRRFDLQLTPGVQTTVDAPGFLGAPPRLAALAAGGYVVTWGTANPTIDTPNADLWAQRLDPALQPVGVVRSIAQETPGEGFGVPVAYADGGFAYVWSTGALLGNAYDGLSARRFDATGTPAGDPVPFHQGPGNNASGPGAIALPSGDTWVVWPEILRPEDPDGGIFAGRFNSSWQLQGRSRGSTPPPAASSPSPPSPPAPAARSPSGRASRFPSTIRPARLPHRARWESSPSASPPRTAPFPRISSASAAASGSASSSPTRARQRPERPRPSR